MNMIEIVMLNFDLSTIKWCKLIEDALEHIIVTLGMKQSEVPNTPHMTLRFTQSAGLYLA